MARNPRVSVGDVAYHVINRANGRERIFSTDTEIRGHEIRRNTGSDTSKAKFGALLGMDLDNVNPGAGEGDRWTGMGTYMADQTGTTNDPKLVVVHAAPPPTPTGDIQKVSYAYDAVGNITGITDLSTSTAKTLTFAYDDLNRLTMASTTAASSTPFKQTYAYDSLGSITGWKNDSGATTTYSYAGTLYANPHAATAIGGTTRGYDENGNATSSGAFAFTWDYRDRLTQVATGTATTTHGYDHEDTRIRKATGTATTTYLNQYFETTGATTTANVFLPDGTLIATIVATSTATSTTYVHADHLNSVAVTTDESGEVASIRDYYPYGAERVSSGDLSRTFLSQVRDTEIDLQYLQARYLDPSRGQFISQDPVFRAVGNPKEVKELTGQDQSQLLSDPQILHAYGYARDNPIVNKDPEGKWVVTAIQLAIRIHGAFSLGYTGGEALNANLLFPNDYSDSQRSEANFYLGLNTLTAGAGPFARNAFEQVILELGPDVARIADEYKNSNANPSPLQNQMSPSQLQSDSIQQRYEIAQTYNPNTSGGGGARGTPTTNSVWVTPSGARVTFGGQTISTPSSSSE